MKILIYSPYSLKFGGGGERWIIEVAPRLEKLGHEVKIVTTEYSGDNNDHMGTPLSNFEKFRQSFDWEEAPYFKMPFGIMLLPLKYVRELTNIANSVDVIYFNNIFTLQEAMILAIKRKVDKPVINMYQAPIIYTSFLNRIYRNTVSRNVVKFFDVHHVLNNHDKQLLERWGIKNVYQIPNGVDTNKFRPTLKKEDPSQFTVLFVGRLNFHKGCDVLCQAIKIANRDLNFNRNIKFLITGSGEMQPEIIRLERNHDNVKYLGQVAHEELIDIYSSSDVLVMPSRWEGLPLVGVEAQACGLPVIGSNTLGTQDVIKDGETGTLIKPESSLDLVNEIKRYYHMWETNQQKYQQIRHRARVHIVSRFDWEIIVDGIQHMLDSVVN